MNAAPVGISSAWSTIRTDAAQQAATAAVAEQQAKAGEARPAPERSPPPPPGQGEHVDRRV